jgi:sugar O-acyltransferase (sialic acid O-acetyltransferase NeuD family)
MTRNLIIMGAGGAAADALWVIERLNALLGTKPWNVLGWVDEDPRRKGELVEGRPILGTPDHVCQEFGGHDIQFHCAVGHNFHRRRLARLFEAAGFEPATLIDPSAIIAGNAQIGPGAYIGPFVAIAARARLGRHAMVNLSASVGHDTHNADFVQICPGARISGHARLGEGAFVGSNGVVAPRVTIAEWATVGAGSLAVRDVPPNVTAFGVPAKNLALPVPT